MGNGREGEVFMEIGKWWLKWRKRRLSGFGRDGRENRTRVEVREGRSRIGIEWMVGEG